LTATNATIPNPGMTKGYSIFYENTSVPAAAVQTTTGSVSLVPTPLPAAIGQVFDSFQLIAAPAAVVGQSAATAQTGQSSTSTTTSTTTSSTSSLAAQTGRTVQTDCDPSYPDVCIPPPPPNLNCDDPGVPENIRVLPPDPHGFDGDNDGIGCESGSGSNQQPNEEQTNDNTSDDNNGGEASGEDSTVQGSGSSGPADDYDETADDEQTIGDCDGC
jgi:hypothetical protein